MIQKPTFTTLQLNILNLLKEGYTPKDLPPILNTSLSNIKYNQRIIQATLGSKTSTHAVIIALRLKIIGLDHALPDH